MNIEAFREYCLSKKATEEAFPFDEVTLVFKVMGKIFAITGLEYEEFWVNLKSDPEYAAQLREEHPDHITPGWHMSKKHWNSVYFERGLDAKFLSGLIDHSYQLIVDKLPKKDKAIFDSL